MTQLPEIIQMEKNIIRKDLLHRAEAVAERQFVTHRRVGQADKHILKAEAATTEADIEGKRLDTQVKRSIDKTAD